MTDLVSGIFNKRIKGCEDSIASMDKNPDRYSDDLYQSQFAQKQVLEELKEKIMSQDVDSLHFGPADTESIGIIPMKFEDEFLSFAYYTVELKLSNIKPGYFEAGSRSNSITCIDACRDMLSILLAQLMALNLKVSGTS